MRESEWLEIFDPAFADFRERVDAGETTRIDPYASEDEGEFFAVASESFFVSPDLLAMEYPALYRLFCRYYRQDPLTRQLRASDSAIKPPAGNPEPG